MEDLRGQVLKMRSCRLSVCGTFGSGRFWGSFSLLRQVRGDSDIEEP